MWKMNLYLFMEPGKEAGKRFLVSDKEGEVQEDKFWDLTTRNDRKFGLLFYSAEGGTEIGIPQKGG